MSWPEDSPMKRLCEIVERSHDRKLTLTFKLTGGGGLTMGLEKDMGRGKVVPLALTHHAPAQIAREARMEVYDYMAQDILDELAQTAVAHGKPMTSEQRDAIHS